MMIWWQNTETRLLLNSIQGCLTLGLKEAEEENNHLMQGHWYTANHTRNELNTSAA